MDNTKTTKKRITEKSNSILMYLTFNGTFGERKDFLFLRIINLKILIMFDMH